MARVRLATAADVLRIVDYTEQLVAAINGPIPVDRPYTAQTAARLIADPRGGVWVSDGGFIAAALVPTVINPAAIAQECGWYATDGTGLRLLREFERWADANAALLKQISTAPDTIDMSRLGYRRAEQAWVK